ncbi:hypothetical protein VTL71DRAFT_262 [Oculimacula yallundae]|uniref:Uncharacterized protein n=1 Tax=Oculimacula yallundae TaxID=86028 RepID=A0ABR4D1W2_9HELO
MAHDLTHMMLEVTGTIQHYVSRFAKRPPASLGLGTNPHFIICRASGRLLDPPYHGAKPIRKVWNCTPLGFGGVARFSFVMENQGPSQVVWVFSFRGKATRGNAIWTSFWSLGSIIILLGGPRSCSFRRCSEVHYLYGCRIIRGGAVSTAACIAASRTRIQTA